MPIVDGRLTCCQCGADLGDASDPYRDPDCLECLERQELEEDARDAERTCPSCYRVWFADGSAVLVDAMDEDEARSEARRITSDMARVSRVENLTTEAGR